MKTFTLDGYIEEIYFKCVNARSTLSVLASTIRSNDEGYYHRSSNVGTKMPFAIHALRAICNQLEPLYDAHQSASKNKIVEYYMVENAQVALHDYLELFEHEIDLCSESTHESYEDGDISNVLHSVLNILNSAVDMFTKMMNRPDDKEAA